MGNQVAV